VKSWLRRRRIGLFNECQKQQVTSVTFSNIKPILLTGCGKSLRAPPGVVTNSGIFEDVFLSLNRFFHPLPKVFLTLLAAVFYPLVAAADDAALTSFVQRLGGTTTLEADFVQTVQDQQGQVLQQTEGRLAIANPGKLRWETRPPYEQLVVSDGKVVWVYDQDLEQVTIRNLEMRVQDTPALLLGGRQADVASNFEVSQFQQDDLRVFHLIPHDKSQLFESLEFAYQADQLVSMTIADATGQVTDIQLSNVARNQPLDGMAFVFDVPEGVDVIDARAGF
jgi:outer membrane lipoprotein carrier protein